MHAVHTVSVCVWQAAARKVFGWQGAVHGTHTVFAVSEQPCAMKLAASHAEQFAHPRSERGPQGDVSYVEPETQPVQMAHSRSEEKVNGCV